MEPRVLVIGYGNSLRTDDAIGFRVAEILAGSFLDDDRVRVVPCTQLLPELTEQIAQASHVVFIDACGRGHAGKVSCHEITAARNLDLFTHQCTPESLLAASDILYGHSPRAWMIAVCGASFDLGEPVTPEVAAALRPAMEQACQLVVDCLEGRDLNLPTTPYGAERVLQILP